MQPPSEDELAYLLGFDGTRFVFEQGYWVKIVVRRVDATSQRPHGLAYSFTLHDAEGRRLAGFDNAHEVRRGGPRGRRAAHDHWHRGEDDEGRPYVFRSAFDLVQDFLNEVERVLRERGVSMAGSDVEGRRRT